MEFINNLYKYFLVILYFFLPKRETIGIVIIRFVNSAAQHSLLILFESKTLGKVNRTDA